MRTAILGFAIFFVSTASAAAGSVGFERATVPDSDGTPREIGIFSFSVGGFTALAAIGGVPELAAER